MNESNSTGLTINEASGSSESKTGSRAEERSQERNTFVVQVRMQQNATWQGSVHWVEGEQTQHFRSALELIRLMDEGLKSKEK